MMRLRSAKTIVALSLFFISTPIARAEVTISRVELVTVTDTSAILTWVTDQPANTMVHYGTQKNRLDQTVSTGDHPTRYHYAEIRDLKPGIKYYYQCQSGSAHASKDALSPGHFTTLIPPPGQELFAFATMTDTHVGESVTARVYLNNKPIRPGVRWHNPNMPFWQLALNASIWEINDRNTAFTIIKGDITHQGLPTEFATAKQLFDQLHQPYYIVHGNHDSYSRRNRSGIPQLLMQTFNLPDQWYSFNHQDIHFVILDTEPFNTTHRHPELQKVIKHQLDWLADDLQKHPNRWTYIFTHRPIPPKLSRSSQGIVSDGLFKLQRNTATTLYGSRAGQMLDNASGRGTYLPEINTIQLVALLREHGRIAGLFAGHMHRNYVGLWPEQTGNLSYVETTATKDYPCGYAITRVFTGGYMHNYYTPKNPDCLQWSAISREAFISISLYSKAGTLADRNFVVRYDDLNLTPTSQPATR